MNGADEAPRRPRPRIGPRAHRPERPGPAEAGPSGPPTRPGPPVGGCLGDGELVAYLDGGSGARPAEAIQSHLDECPACRRLAAAAAAGPGPAPRGAPSVRSFDAGARIAGRYLVRRFLAAGGMGEVYEASDALLGGRVALKTLCCTAQDDPIACARLRREARLARTITHPNVCRVLELGAHEGEGGAVPFFTMELLEGETLACRLAREGPLPAASVWPLARQLAAAVDAIHAAGVVHRDIKSENVFLLPTAGPSGEPFKVVVTDFGLARPLDGGAPSSCSRAGVVVGTAAYMAPEQAAGFGATARSDVYSVGVTLFEALTGRRPAAPWGAPQGPGAPPAPISPLPREWAPLLGRCLAIQPEQRFASAGRLLAALDRPAPARRVRDLLAAGAVALAAGALWRG